MLAANRAGQKGNGLQAVSDVSRHSDMRKYQEIIAEAEALPMNISISLTPELIGLIKAKVQSGRYTSTSEVVREALRLLERADRQEAERVKALRRAWKEGIDSGDAGELDFAGLREAAKRELASHKKK